MATVLFGTVDFVDVAATAVDADATITAAVKTQLLLPLQLKL